MSGENRKKNKVQGWEDAGVEFYQENYLSNEVELQDVLRKDPKNLATLLPSKQNRAYSTVRMRRTDTKTRTVRRQTATKPRRENSICRPTAAAETQVSMLPDLSELISNEQTAWEQIMRIKELPITMTEKREMKQKIQNSPNLRLQGFEQFKWKRRKMLQRFKQQLSEVWSKLDPWKSDMKNMERHFGTGMVAYFLFVKWLIFHNFIMFSIIFIFVTFPMYAVTKQDFMCKNNFTNTSDCCLAAYLNYSNNFEDTTTRNLIEEFIQGTGRMEYTPLFYGYYIHQNISYEICNKTIHYSLSLAYVATISSVLLLSLFLIVKEVALGFKRKVIEEEGQLHKYCNLVFGCWDFCIHNQKTAHNKKCALYNEMKNFLAVDRLGEEKQHRTNHERVKIIIIRVVINIIEFSILTLCAFTIYIAFNFSAAILLEDPKDVEKLFYGYLPSITTRTINVIVPVLFKYLIKYEKYSYNFNVNILFVKMVVLRLSSIMFFYCSMHSVFAINNMNCLKSNYKCWETYMGQHIFRLIITDFVTHIIGTFIVNFPRSFLEKRVQNKVMKLIGEQNFDLRKHVLDIAYLQTLSFLGIFYAPLLPGVFVFILFCMFYIKKIACTVNSKPCTIIHRASTSKSMFMNTLLVSYIIAVLPVAYTISEIKPSESCGPFRDLSTTWEIVRSTLDTFPVFLQNFANNLTTPSIAIAAFIVLVLLLYYYAAVNNANRHMVRVLKDQLVLEGHDKQFLLERLSMFIKQQQDYQTQFRRFDDDIVASST